MKKLLTLLIVCLAWPGWADTHTAASTSYAHVSAAYTACSDGDTLAIPAGASTWSDILLIEKAITIAGAGPTNTILTAGVDSYFQLEVGSGESWSVSGITFNLGNIQNWNGVLSFSGGIGKIYNCIFTNSDSVHLAIGNCIGVGYSNTFRINSMGGIMTSHSAWQGVGNYGDYSWATDHTMGTTNTWVWEDNVFWGTSGNHEMHDANSGARVCFRYNLLTNTYPIAHGTDSSGRPRSIRQFEFYCNRQYCGDAGNEMRGGTGIVFSNLFQGPSSCVMLKYFRSDGGPFSDPWGEWPNGWDYPNSPYYPAIDQPGRGKGDDLNGSTNAVYLNQQAEPWYSWGNTNLSGTAIIIGSSYFAAALGVEGRDWTNGIAKPGYTPLTYPHPLRGEGGGGVAAPSRLRVLNQTTIRSLRGR